MSDTDSKEEATLAPLSYDDKFDAMAKRRSVSQPDPSEIPAASLKLSMEYTKQTVGSEPQLPDAVVVEIEGADGRQYVFKLPAGATA